MCVRGGREREIEGERVSMSVDKHIYMYVSTYLGVSVSASVSCALPVRSICMPPASNRLRKWTAHQFNNCQDQVQHLHSHSISLHTTKNTITTIVILQHTYHIFTDV